MEKEEKIRYCKICGGELTETNQSKENKSLCLDCEGKGENLGDHTQKNVNQDGTSEEGTL